MTIEMLALLPQSAIRYPEKRPLRTAMISIPQFASAAGLGTFNSVSFSGTRTSTFAG